MINYYLLTKPGIIMGNLVTLAAGFLLASKGMIDFRLFFATLLGLAFIMASACVFNNYIDRQIDKKMERTKNRALVKGIDFRAQCDSLRHFSWIVGNLNLVYHTPIF